MSDDYTARMPASDVVLRVLEIVAREMEIDPGILYCDSLDFIELIFATEEAFGLPETSDADAEKIVTGSVATLVEYVQRCLAAKESR